MRKIIYYSLSIVLVGAILLGIWVTFPAATPVDELLPQDADINLEAYETSQPHDAGSPDVLILGTTHLAQSDHDYEQNAFDKVNASLSSYEPDMIVVEYLPPDYPEGKGRDYRPSFDRDHYASEWGMNSEHADSLVVAHREGEMRPDEPCTLGKAYFIKGDFANAPYFWLTNFCEDVREHEEIDTWLDRRAEHEMAQIGYPLAWQNDISELVSFDYQGDDAEWFIFDKGADLLRGGHLSALAAFSPILPYVGTTSRQWRAHFRQHEDDLTSLLRFANSPDLIGLQYWAYEEVYPRVTWDGEALGAQQTENYWLRNEKMFEYMQDAIEEEQPERVLVIVGLGHKYFLDELVREADYRWIEPREWLPPAVAR